MKGLFAEDLRLILKQKRLFLVIGFILLFYMFYGTNIQFVIGYATVMGMILAISSIGYEEHNKGQLFLFTLPFDRKEYVIEKYLFGFLMSLAAWAVGAAAGGISLLIRAQAETMREYRMTVWIYPLVALVGLSLILPWIFRYGTEKGRLIFFAVMFIGAVFLEIVQELPFVMDFLAGIKASQWIWGGIAAVLLLLTVSIWCSMQIIKRKQF